jgi:ribonuclease R
MTNTFTTNEIVYGAVKSTGKKYGFLVTNLGDIFIPPLEYQKVFAGDVVKGRIFMRNEKPQVEIIEVQEHKYKSYIGIYKMTEKGAFVVPEARDESVIHQWLRVPKAKRLKANDGDYVRVSIIEYPIENRKPKGEITKVIGQVDSANFEANYYFEKSQLPVYFSGDLTDRSYEYDSNFISKRKSDRTNLTMLPFITIDGENTRDIDDAIFCKKSEDGWKLWVAISDVSAFIEEGDEIDEEAYKRGSSVYTPLRYAGMLPPNLSSNLCSLVADVERLAMVCYMQIANDGSVQNYSFYEAVIRSKAQMTYTEVEQFLNNSLDVDYDSSVINNLSNICDVHRKLREHRKTNLLISPREDHVRYVFDEDRQAQDISISEYQQSNEVVEEIMLVANMTAAQFLSKNYEHAIYRSNHGLKEEDIDVLTSYLKDVGIDITGDISTIEGYRENFPKIQENKGVLRAMNVFVNKSEYSNDPDMHLSLGVDKYTYFTSPIRRYADILVHRLIKKVLHGTECKEVTSDVVAHLNSLETNIQNVNNNIVRLMNCKLMRNMKVEKAKGTIIEINRFGCKVHLDDYNVDGFLHVQSFNKHMEYDNALKKLTSDQYTLQLGDLINVEIKEINIDNRNIFLKLEEKS